MTISIFVSAFLLTLKCGCILYNHSRRIQQVDRKLNLVLTHLDIDPTPQVAHSALASPSSDVLTL
jgi:hypothetical protein